MLRIAEMGQDGKRQVGKSSEELSCVHVRGALNFHEGLSMGSGLCECGCWERVDLSMPIPGEPPGLT